MRRQKFNAKPVVLDGIRFASTREGNRYLDLKLMMRAGMIRDLELQPKFEMHSPAPNGELVKVGVYRGDFRYTGSEGQVIEDVKSSATRTESYRLRKRMVEAEYGLQITEV